MKIETTQSFLDYYGKIRSRTNRLISVVKPEHMECAYMPGKFTVGDIIRHIAAIERFMFAETIAGRQSRYKGCGKDLADGLEATLRFFDDMHIQSMEIFSNIKDEHLADKCITPANASITISKWLLAMTEHEIHHRGQLCLYLNMLGVKTPPMFGLTSEELKEMSG